jgi:uncharacterized peroxidase-related enzyme
MQRMEPIDLDHAPAQARELVDEYAARAGAPGPMVRTMAHAPALLRGYLDLNRAMKRSHLNRRTERIALAAQEWIGCAYCVAAHTAAARKLGLSDRDIELAKQGTATDPTIASIVAFGQQVIAPPAEISDAEIERLRNHAYSDEQIAEVVGIVSLNAADRRLQPGRRHRTIDHREERRMSTPYLAWAAADRRRRLRAMRPRRLTRRSRTSACT